MTKSFGIYDSAESYRYLFALLSSQLGISKRVHAGGNFSDFMNDLDFFNRECERKLVFKSCIVISSVAVKHEFFKLVSCEMRRATVIMTKPDKIAEGQIQLDDVEYYRPLATPMVEENSARVERLITELHHSDHIDTMTRKWLSQTANLPHIPEVYTLTKIRKAKPVGRPIISGCRTYIRTYNIICR